MAIGGLRDGAGRAAAGDTPVAEVVFASAPPAMYRTGDIRKAFKLRDNMLDIMGYASLFGAERQAATRVTL
jgi:hypothetical protein